MSIPENSRIAKNTLMLYIRQILILFVSLYSVRALLNVLGIQDYGVYNVVGGIVTFFSFLSGTMASATQRFFAYAIGEKNIAKLRETFSATCIIYIAIAIAAFILLETVGFWFVSNHLNIPAGKHQATFVIYHLSVLTFVATIISAPFAAIIIAHEDMHIYAYLSIVEAVGKLAAVFILGYLQGDKLEIYGRLVFGAACVSAIAYLLIAIRRYDECQFKKLLLEKNLLVEMIKFTGWTLFGQVSNVARNQATTILINQLYSPIVVAARAIAVSVTNQINVFSNSFNTGLYPPIIKLFASNKRDEMFSLINTGSLITFFLMWVLALPVFMKMDLILETWLSQPPQDAVLFTRLSLIEVLITSVGLPLTTAARAPGKMRTYELSIGGIQFLTFVFTWIALVVSKRVESVFWVAIIANLVIFGLRLILLKVLIDFSINQYVSKVLWPILLIVAISTSASFLVNLVLPTTFFFSCLSIIFSVMATTASMYFIGLDAEWRQRIIQQVKKRLLESPKYGKRASSRL